MERRKKTGVETAGRPGHPTVRLGLMPPFTGVCGIYGQEISRAGTIACQEVNEGGGVLGRPLELIMEDDGSLPESSVRAAGTLLDRHGCVGLIGNLMTNSRIAVAYRIAEPRRVPYLCFSLYEGSVASRYYFHFAALPNQQIDFMVPYMKGQYGPRMFFCGNNYEWPRGSVDAAKRILAKAGGLVVGEQYCSIGMPQDEAQALMENVSRSGADVLVPFFAGSDEVTVLTQFAKAGLGKRIKVVMTHFDEVMASHLPPEARQGLFSSNSYFMAVDTPENQAYLRKLAALPGVDGLWPRGNGIVTNFGEGTYLCVKAFAQAANRAGSLDPEAIVDALETVSLAGPQGRVDMDRETHHATVNSYLARCGADGAFSIIKAFGPVAPVIPEKYRYQKINPSTNGEDLRLEARIVDQMTDAMCLVGALDNKVVYINRGFERMFGYGKGDIIGKPASLLNRLSKEDYEGFIAEINKGLYHEGIWHGERMVIRKDGAPLWCLMAISAFTHPHGEMWLVRMSDITARKRLEERLQIATRAADIGIWDWDVVKDELVWDDAMYALYGIRREDFAGAYDAWSRTIHPDDKARAESDTQAALRGERDYAPEFRVIWPDGSIHHIKANALIFRSSDGRALRMVGTNFDITERKQAEEEIRRLNAEL